MKNKTFAPLLLVDMVAHVNRYPVVTLNAFVPTVLKASFVVKILMSVKRIRVKIMALVRITMDRISK